MSKKDEALKLALEALEWINRVSAMDYEYQQKARESLNAIYEALAEQQSGIKQVIELYDSPEQPASNVNATGGPKAFFSLAEQPTPPGWIDELAKVPDNAWPAQQEPFGYFRYDLRLDAWVQNRAGLTGTPFYTSPPVSKPWVGLTDDEIIEALNSDERDAMKIYHAIEAKLREKNA